MIVNVICFVLLLLVSQGLAELYVFERETEDEVAATTMHIMDRTTGDIVQTVGATGVGQITAAAFRGERLLTTHGGGGCCPVAGLVGCLLDSNVDTGTTTVIACDPVYGSSDNLPGLAVDSSGNVFGMLLTSNAGLMDGLIYLVSIDPVTSVFTVIGQTGEWCAGNGIEFGPDDTLYFQDDCQGFGTVDLSTGALTPINPDATDIRVTDMSYDHSTGTMFAMASGDERGLFTVDLKTGVFKHVASFRNINSLACKCHFLRTLISFFRPLVFVKIFNFFLFILTCSFVFLKTI